MPTFVGYIRNTKVTESKPGAKKAWKAYRAEIHSTDGKVQSISFGFEQPEVGAGDYVTLDAHEENGFMKVDPSTIRRLEEPKQEAPKSEPIVSNASGPSSSTRGADRQESIVMQHSQEMAINFLDVLAKHDALPFSKATGKTGVAKRFEEFVAAMDKLTVKFYNDATTTRILATVQDMGIIDTTPSSTLPTEDANLEGKELDK